MEIEVSVKNVYGNETFYPEDAKARIFCKIAGTKTMTRKTIRGIQDLGHTIKVIPVCSIKF